MTTDSGQSGRLDNVTAHVSGELRVDPSIDHRAAAPTGARATSRVGAAVAHAPSAS